MAREFQIAVVCRAPTVEAMRGEMFRNAPRADLLEVRLDSLAPEERGQLAGCFHAPPRPTIATARREIDGGSWEGEEDERIAALERAAEAGTSWIDLEWGSPALRLIGHSFGAGTIVSHHELHEFPEDPRDLASAMAAAGGDAVKLALACPRVRDVLALADTCRFLAGQEVRTIAVPVGLESRWGRLWAPAWGSYAGYFLPVAGDSRTLGDDPLGGIPVDVAEDLFGVTHVGQHTRVFGVAGQGVSRSLSPALHMAALREAGIDGLYVPLELASSDFEDLLRHPGTFPFEGLSVTTPFKVAACELVTRLEGAAAEAGALNTIRREPDGSTTGFNTDGAALRELVESRLPLGGARCVVLGAGGAARGVAQAMLQAGARVLLLNRTAERARDLAKDLGCEWGTMPDDQGEVAKCDVLINATPLGDGHIGPGGGKGVNPVSEAVLQEGEGLVVDLVYRPRQTRLLREAARAGWDVLDGAEVLLRQAAAQFQIWTGLAPNVEAMREAL